VLARPVRRRYSAAYKLSIIEQAADCTTPGDLGALLRREGLYSSALCRWRQAYRDHGMDGLQEPRGRPPADPTGKEVARLQAENARLTKELEAARLIIDVQKKVAALLDALGEPSG
jgi:transposase-like protein